MNNCDQPTHVSDRGCAKAESSLLASGCVGRFLLLAVVSHQCQLSRPADGAINMHSRKAFRTHHITTMTILSALKKLSSGRGLSASWTAPSEALCWRQRGFSYNSRLVNSALWSLQSSWCMPLIAAPFSIWHVCGSFATPEGVEMTPVTVVRPHKQDGQGGSRKGSAMSNQAYYLS